MITLRLAALAAALAFPLFVSAQMAAGPSLSINKENRTISLSATDHAEADPDVADLHIGYTAYGATLKDAYKTASDSSNAIIKAILDAGASRSEIQSQNQFVSRLNDYEIKAQKGMKYSVQQSWTVSVVPKDAALVLDAAVEAGANQSGDINWRMKNSVALDAEAIRLATEHAHAMAVELAHSMGVTLGKPIYATNTIQGSPMPRVFAAQAERAREPGPPPLSIEARRVQSTATVQIIYAIE